MLLLAKILGVLWLTIAFIHGATIIEVKYFALRRDLDLGKGLFYLIVICWYAICIQWWISIL